MHIYGRSVTLWMGFSLTLGGRLSPGSRAGCLSHKYQTWGKCPGYPERQWAGSCPPGNTRLSWLSWEQWALLAALCMGSAVLLREQHNRTERGPWGAGRETIAEIGLLGYITTWILFCWCAQILAGVCSGGGVQTELGVLVACMQVECTAVKCDVLVLPELWHFCLILSSGGPCNGIWQ